MLGASIRKAAMLEPMLVFLMIMQYIWALRYSHPAMWLLILGLILLSHRVRRERAQALGFEVGGLRNCWEEYAPALVFLVLALVASGILMQTTRPISFDRALLSWVAYMPWGLFQQYVLNGYFLNRFDAVFSRRAAPLLAAALFSSAHLPNGFLMAVTLILGYLSTHIYRKYNNLYFLGLAHGTVGFCLFLVVPDSISHHLTVGPGWFSHP